MFGTEHESHVLSTAEYVSKLPDLLRMVEEPVGSTSALAPYFVAQRIQPHAPVALCGQGADEPLGGYWRHLGTKLTQALRPAAGAAAALQPLAGVLRGDRIRRGLGAIKQNDLDLLMATYQVLSTDAKARLYTQQFRDSVEADPGWEVERLRVNVGHLEPLAQMLYVDTRLWLPNELLLIADKTAMACSVELRVPFLDEALVSLIESMHSSQKVRGLSRKSIHKRAMLKWLPHQVVYRKERGWATPMARWLREELKPLLSEVLFADGELVRELFEPAQLRALVDDHASGRDRTRELFCLLGLGLWHREVACTRSSCVRSSAPAIEAPG